MSRNRKVLTEEDFNLPTEKQIRADLERDIREIVRETGAPRIAELEAERRARMSTTRRLSINPHTDELPKHSPIRREIEAAQLKPVKPEKPKKAAVPDGFKTISQLATEWGIAPPDARACLRGSGLEKPSYGWAFGPNDIKRIKKICGVK